MKTTLAAAAAAVLLAGSAQAEAPKAPEPAKPVDAASFFAGRWYEIGRTPGQNTKVHVSYRLFGAIPIAREYWMLDHGEGWFIQRRPT
jgi:lipocalin